MNPQHIEHIVISKIRVTNPRDRNQQTFRGIVANVGLVGLKKPITVHHRKLQGDGTEYDLICGQGRMEAIAALGGRTVPAIITNASLRERHMMSLIENIARKRPPLTDLITEVQSLTARGYSNTAIAGKLGLGKGYIDGIARLLRCGEDQLVARVTSGTVPLSVALKIATATDSAVQKALADAYASGELRGTKLLAVQRIITQRTAKGNPKPTLLLNPNVTPKDLVRQYESHTERQRTLMKRATLVHERLTLLVAAFKRMLGDNSFVELLRMEGLNGAPEVLATSGERPHVRKN